MEGNISYYKILGVKENATSLELRKAFYKLSKELHPDTTLLDLEDARNKFQKVLEAYENLNNTNLRRTYDEKLKKISKSNNLEKNEFNNLVFDSQNNRISGNRRPFSNGEMFSLFLLIVIIVFCLISSLIFASFTGRELNTIPNWLQG